MRKIYFIVFIVISMGFIACEYTPYENLPEPVIEEEVSFTDDIEPIFTDAGCTSCHNGGQNPNLTVGNAYNSLTSNQDYVDLSSDDNIYVIAAPGNQHFKNYTPEQAALVKAWIEQGTQNN